MSPRRDRPITAREAAVGAFLILAAFAGVVALSYALLIPAEVEGAFRAPVDNEEDANDDTSLVARRCAGAKPVGEGDQPPAVTSEDLIECPDLYDGLRVAYEGEVVGAVMRRGTGAWLHVNDDPYGLALGPLPTHRLAVGGNAGMAVFVPVASAEGLRTGSFNRRGTGLAITGTYFKNHPADAGSPAIDADGVDVVREAESVDHPVSLRRLVAAGLLILVTIGLAVAWRVRR